MLLIGIHADVVAPMDEGGIHFYRVGRFGLDVALTLEDLDVEEGVAAREVTNYRGRVNLDLGGASASAGRRVMLNRVQSRVLLTCAVKAGTSLGKPDMST